MTQPIAEQLRQQIVLLRTKPIPLADMIPLMQRAADALDAQVQSPAVVEVPAGYAVVPLEPTPEMQEAGSNCEVEQDRGGTQCIWPSEAIAIYKVMLAAAPAQQGAEPSDARDAARYRWLRAGNYSISFARVVLNDTPHGIDEAIDAAMPSNKGASHAE